MNLFQIKAQPHGIERFRQFIDEKFVCIGWPEIGNLDQVSKDEIRERIRNVYGYTGHKLGNNLGHVNAFCNTMKKGDIVFIAENDEVYFGRLGDYEYKAQYDNTKDGMCHTRQVEWMGHESISSFNSDVQKFIKNRNTICKYPVSMNEAEFEELISKKTLIKSEDSIKLDSLFGEALRILEEELKSEDPERRLKAATELIRLKNK